MPPPFLYSTAPRIPPGLGLDGFGHLGSCMTQEASYMRVGLKSWNWLTSTNLGPICGQIGSKLSQVGAKLAPCCLKLGPSWLHNRLQEGQGGCPRSSQESPGSLLGVARGQEALQEAPEVPKWPPGDSKIHEKSVKSISDLRALASE